MSVTASRPQHAPAPEPAPGPRPDFVSDARWNSLLLLSRITAGGRPGEAFLTFRPRPATAGLLAHLLRPWVARHVVGEPALTLDFASWRARAEALVSASGWQPCAGADWRAGHAVCKWGTVMAFCVLDHLRHAAGEDLTVFSCGGSRDGAEGPAYKARVLVAGNELVFAAAVDPFEPSQPVPAASIEASPFPEP